MMSIWYDVTDLEDVDLSKDGLELHINYMSDNQGNYYVSVPTAVVLEAIKQHLINAHRK